MNRKLLIAAALAGFAAGAFADDITFAPELERFVSTKSRAEVRAETIAAAQSGQIARHDGDAQRLAHQGFVSTKTRAQVVAETAEARRFGLTVYGEAGPPTATPEQNEMIRLAGLRALSESFALKP